jgi:hypothetical protein
MRIENLTEEAQSGLRAWASHHDNDPMLFDGINSVPTEWAWQLLRLKESEDRPEWFPHGKWGTLQFIEQKLMAEAKASLCEVEE